MSIKEYQERAMGTCTSSSNNFAYMSYGLMEEVGEFFGKVAKAVRKEKAMVDYNRLVTERKEAMTDEEIEALRKELGDIQWFVAGIASVMGWNLEEIASENLAKLADRAKRNVIVGEGDNR